ncbi:MAG TPA: hypothetical protein VME18_03160 [Acidobacteriaceae bacterium]|nr:hypothetical protein [Acidobacteriaceae bacterium]
MNTEITTEVLWRRFKNVSVCGEEIFWAQVGSQYSLFEAYEHLAHREFMSAGDDGALRAFARRWGPLRNAEAGQDSLAWYRRARERLLATANLMVLLEQGKSLRLALERLAICSEEHDPLTQHLKLRRDGIRRPTDVSAWCLGASSTDVDKLCVSFLSDFPFVCVPRFVVERRRGRYQIRASLFINNLHEALWWMVWQDRFLQHPFSFCQNCGQFIHRTGHRTWKYCGEGRCAKRKADRDYWRRRHGKNLRYRKDGQ